MIKFELYKKIEIMRAKLHDLIDHYGVDSEIVLSFSQELDKLLCELQHMDDDN